MPSPLLESVARAFVQAGWEFHAIEGREVLQAGFDAHHTRIVVHAQAFPELGAVSVVAELPLVVDEGRRGRIAELLMRVNQRLTVGNFELAWDQGLVMFRATNVFGESPADAKIINSLVHTAIAETDRIAPAVSIIRQIGSGELADLDLESLLQREDLLPPVDPIA